MAERIYKIIKIEDGQLRALDATFKRAQLSRMRPLLSKLGLYYVPQVLVPIRSLRDNNTVA